ncbi:MAG: SET domain-containing protein-lysine N-methyltransferase [bacterium]
MKNYVKIGKSKIQGKGLFATTDIKKGTHIFHLNLTGLKTYTSKEIAASGIDSEHWDYVGHSRYVLDNSPAAYMNHACDPNCIVKMRTIAIKDIYALKDIKKNGELTHDYSLSAVDRIGKKDNDGWGAKCHCGSINCRKKISGDFFRLPKKLQLKYYKFLPLSIKKKYQNKIRKLLSGYVKNKD